MLQSLDVLLDYFKRIGVEYNLHQSSYWGVLFHKKADVRCALVATPYFTVEIEGIGIEPGGEFFSYFDNAWTKNMYPKSYEEILGIISTNKNYIGKMIVPFSNLLNHINKVGDDKDKRKSRLIFSPANPLEKGDLLLKFSNVIGRLQFSNASIPKKFLIDEHSFIPRSMVIPETTYRCRIVGEDEDFIFVTCLEMYGRVRLGIQHSEGAFIPDDMIEINQLRRVPQNKIMCINIVEPANLTMPPIHVDCMMFYDVLKIIGITGSTFVEIHVGDHINHELLIRNIRESDQQPQINIVFATLNQNFGPQRR